MLNLTNIDRLVGYHSGNWRCGYAEEVTKDGYHLSFESLIIPNVKAVLNLSRNPLYSQNNFDVSYNMQVELWNINNPYSTSTNGASRVAMVLLTPTKKNLSSPANFCDFILPTLHKFENDMQSARARQFVQTHNTSSFGINKTVSVNANVSNGHITSVTKNINGGGHPAWHVPVDSEEHLSSFRKFLKYTFWDNTPMGWLWRKIFGKKKLISKQAPPHLTNQFGHQIPVNKPSFKKAWH